MVEALWEVLQIIGLLYCAGVGLLMCCIYLIMLIRLTDYAIHFDDPEDEENKE